MFFSIIVAVGNQNQIGKDNKLLWTVKEDMLNFKSLTLNHTIIMGRKTFASIGKALPNRENIVLTRNKNYFAENCIVLHSLNDIIEYCEDKNEVFVIGGAEIYKIFLNNDLPLKKIYISYIDCNLVGDKYFPIFNKNNWNITYEKNFFKSNINQYNFKYIVYEKL